MKSQILKMIFVLLLPVVIGIGCEDDNHSDVLKLDQETLMISHKQDGILYEFFLTDESDEPSIQFQEGTNFSLVFKVSNQRSETLYFYPEYAYSNDNDFFRVFASNDKDLGKPFVFLGAEKIGVGGYPFTSDDTYFFKQPWQSTKDFTWKSGSYKANNNQMLEKGNYYTCINQVFEFTSNDNTTINHKLKFSINFEIR